MLLSGLSFYTLKMRLSDFQRVLLLVSDAAVMNAQRVEVKIALDIPGIIIKQGGTGGLLKIVFFSKNFRKFVTSLSLSQALLIVQKITSQFQGPVLLIKSFGI